MYLVLRGQLTNYCYNCLCISKSHPAWALSSSQPGGPPYWASPLAFGLFGCPTCTWVVAPYGTGEKGFRRNISQYFSHKSCCLLRRKIFFKKGKKAILLGSLIIAISPFQSSRHKISKHLSRKCIASFTRNVWFFTGLFPLVSL